MYQCYNCLVLLKKRKKSIRMYIMYIYETQWQKNWIFNLVESVNLWVFDPFICYSIDSCFIETWFFQVYSNGVIRIEFLLIFSVSVCRFWNWKMNASGCLFSASGYAFQASRCFFQHPHTLFTTYSILTRFRV